MTVRSPGRSHANLKLATVTIASRFCGPPGSGNGGYTVGSLARYAPEPMTVRLHLPPPLDVPLDVVAADGDSLQLSAGTTVYASATPASVEFAVPAAPTPAAAREATTRYAGLGTHPFPNCFVCGPARAAGDGLRIFAGSLASDPTLYAAPWQPDESLAGTRRAVRPEFMAAALDCPGYFAIGGGRLMLLGSLSVRIDRAVSVGEPCSVVAWSLGGAGRKWRAATAIYGADGECVARASATWIELQKT